MSDNELLALKKYGGIAVLVIAFIVLLLNTVVIISPQSKGMIETLGKISYEIDSGLHFKIPFVQNATIYNLSTINKNVEINVDSKGAITKDNQTIGSSIAVFYRLRSDRIKDIRSKYSLDSIESIINKTTEQKFKEIAGQNTIFDIAANQQKIAEEVRKSIIASIADYPFEIENVQITNYDWSDDFDNNIKATMNRAQQVKQKEQELLITEQETQKIVKEAEAKKQAAALDAEAKAITGEGIRRYNEEIAKTIDIEKQFRQLEIEKIRAEKWNGVSVSQQVFTPIPLDLNPGVKK